MCKALFELFDRDARRHKVVTEVGPTPKHLTLTPGALVCGLSMLAHPTAVSTSPVVELAAQGSLQT